MRRNRSYTDLVVWHCSATPPSQDIGSAQIDIMHKARGWDGIGYHLVICRDGTVEMGEDLKKVGAHAKGHNSTSAAVVMVGGVDENNKAENNFTAEQWVAAKHVYEFLVLLYPSASHVGHRDLSPDTDNDGRIQRHEFMKDCPCFSVVEWQANDLESLSALYAEWELDEEVEVPEEELTFEELIEDEDTQYEYFEDEGFDDDGDQEA